MSTWVDLQACRVVLHKGFNSDEPDREFVSRQHAGCTAVGLVAFLRMPVIKANAVAAEGADVDGSGLEPKESDEQCRMREAVVSKASAARSRQEAGLSSKEQL
jgi:hypothetical protein